MTTANTNTTFSLVASLYKILHLDIEIHNFVSNLRLYFQPLSRTSQSPVSTIKSNKQIPEKNHQQNCLQVAKEDVKLVMDKLGICYDSDDHQNMLQVQDRFGVDEFKELIEKEPISMEEVKEAFDVFDKNRDGFIDARELQRVLCGLGLKEGKELEDCTRMIMAADENNDQLIDFTEFVRFLETTFN